MIPLYFEKWPSENLKNCLIFESDPISILKFRLIKSHSKPHFQLPHPLIQTYDKDLTFSFTLKSHLNPHLTKYSIKISLSDHRFLISISDKTKQPPRNHHDTTTTPPQTRKRGRTPLHFRDFRFLSPRSNLYLTKDIVAIDDLVLHSTTPRIKAALPLITSRPLVV